MEFDGPPPSPWCRGSLYYTVLNRHKPELFAIDGDDIAIDTDAAVCAEYDALDQPVAPTCQHFCLVIADEQASSSHEQFGFDEQYVCAATGNEESPLFRKGSFQFGR